LLMVWRVLGEHRRKSLPLLAQSFLFDWIWVVGITSEVNRWRVNSRLLLACSDGSYTKMQCCSKYHLKSYDRASIFWGPENGILEDCGARIVKEHHQGTSVLNYEGFEKEIALRKPTIYFSSCVTRGAEKR